jgi:hypothetical protein
MLIIKILFRSGETAYEWMQQVHLRAAVRVDASPIPMIGLKGYRPSLPRHPVVACVLYQKKHIAASLPDVLTH